MRTQGFLEGLELEAYDWSLRLCPTPGNEFPPITLITITEHDIQRLGHWPISDAMLATVLTRYRLYGLEPLVSTSIGIWKFRQEETR